ncbi:MAG: hypothetical protein OXH00_26075 [Candidatus Poribacteria bacterium]|nr:hypothetical protein [Candidatus Poribacteria bacterium]
MEYILFRAEDYDEFIVLRGKRVKTEEHPFWPFFHATFILDKASALRVGNEQITVSESEILSDCEVPEVPVEASVPKPTAPVQSPKPKPPVQLTLWETV